MTESIMQNVFEKDGTSKDWNTVPVLFI